MQQKIHYVVANRILAARLFVDPERQIRQWTVAAGERMSGSLKIE
jgi:hypothetical protein